MNKYIRKCLIVYVSLAIILCGMVGVTYAITASDADQYVTRSQFATDMTNLQLQIDEKESSIMGDINRYRATDIKFSTFDTPDKTYNGSDSSYAHGYYNGGNWFPRKFKSGKTQYGWGMYDSLYDKQQSNRRNNLMLYRLWNGNYFISQALSGKESLSNDSAVEYWVQSKCAVPLEDLPGWYVTLGYDYNNSSVARNWMALVKLDPTVPMPDNAGISAIQNGEHTIRFKKDLWQYNSDQTQSSRALTTTVQTYTVSTAYYQNQGYMGALIPAYLNNRTSGGTAGVTWKGWLDPDTGDYMVSFKGMSPCCNYHGDIVWRNDNANQLTTRFIPRDNVEYMMGPAGSVLQYDRRQAEYARWAPDPRFIGTGHVNDRGWTHEFVDCVNGIKYYHAKYQPFINTDNVNSYNQIQHYSLPIVY